MIFIFPTELEAAPFRMLNPSADVVIGGVGMAEIAATITRLINNVPPPSTIILAGIAGAYNAECNPLNQVVEVVSEQIEELPKQFSKTYNIAPKWGLPQASSNTVNSSTAIISTPQSQIENMEGAAAAAICEVSGIEFHEIRAISNRVGDPFRLWSIDTATESLSVELSKIYHKK